MQPPTNSACPLERRKYPAEFGLKQLPAVHPKGSRFQTLNNLKKLAWKNELKNVENMAVGARHLESASCATAKALLAKPIVVIHSFAWA